ncbi:MAG: sigma-70 family RNA polymerase sigma factor [Gemmataceae bacterium]|nr:sigma-70 family RNA polymerase sigma factor [Gemmataceae bacterium]
MGQATSNPLLHLLRRAAAAGAAPLVADSELLQRFLQTEDRSAFELLLWRHGPMVLRVCQGVARDAHDAEDAFQATFLTLARKAGSIDRGEALGAWLYRVAYRVALKAYREGRRRAAQQRQGLDLSELPDDSPSDPLAQAELERLLHAEVERLPAKYQAPVVLCYLEGRTNEEAAAQLGWTKGTVSGRLARARELLRRRLERCGLPSAGLALTLLTCEAAALPGTLVYSTLHAAALAASGGALAGAVSPAVLSLTQGAIPVMVSIKLKLVLALLCLGAGAGIAYSLVHPSEQGTADPVAAPVAPQLVRARAAPAAVAPVVRPEEQGNQDKPPPVKPKVVRLPSPTDGILLAIGTEVKQADKAEQGVYEVRSGDEVRWFRRLAEGDLVQEGQVLAQLDDRLPRKEVEINRARLVAAEAEYAAAVTLKTQAQARLDRIAQLKGKVISEEEYEAAVATRDKYRQEEISRKQAIAVARIEVEKASTVLAMHTIRSPVRGRVHAILRQRGEAVRRLETVFEIRQDTEAKPPPVKPKVMRLPSRVDGILLAVGTEVPSADKAKPGVFAVRGGDEVRWFRRLVEGDLVQEGQVLARLDDNLPRKDLEIKRARLRAAEADHAAAATLKAEAQARLKRAMPLGGPIPRPEEEYSAVVATRDKYYQEEAVKKEVVRIAQIEVQQAQAALEMYTIRSPVRGHIRQILRRQGEAVRSFETVFEIGIAEKQ